MGYLDVPRIHFAGLFYTGPSTINNLTTNYMPQVPLEKPDGQFNRNALWYPTGLAQIFLHNCKCLGAVDGTGEWIGSGDPLIGAPVETPSPYTPVEDGQGGVYDIAKMVDVDPDQQGRSAVFGLRFLVTIPGGATFGGAAGVPELREMGPRVALKLGSFTAVGQWMTTIDQPRWPAGTTTSPLLNAFRNACTNGIAVDMTVDLHWNFPQISQNGLMFCYGRVHGTMGPLRAGESGQILHGRRLPAVAAQSVAAPLRREAVAAITAAAADASPASMPQWNTTYAAATPAGTPDLLHVDIGMSVPLAIQSATPLPPAVDGRPLVETGIAVGTIDDTGAFKPLANGNVSFPPYYQSLQSMEKNCTLWTNSGVFTIKLAAGEAALLASRPLAVAVSGNAVTQEAASGTWVQMGEMVGRMALPGANISIPVVITQRGTPAANQTPPSPAIQMIEWSKDDKGNWNGNTEDSTDLTAAFDPPQTDSNGSTTLQIASAVPDLKLSQVRAALDSRMYYIALNAPDSVSVSDDYVPVSVLLWRPFAAPPEPAWEQDIQPILGAYARLYPGMKDRVDIGTESIVRGNALSIMQRMSLPMSDPGYMPVTRDLAPAKVQMIVKFMQSWLAQQNTAT